MEPKLEETIYVDFITSAADGSAADADSLPTAEVFENATDTTTTALTVTKRTSKTGNYRVPIACTAANTFEANKSYNVVATAIVGGVTAKAIVARFQVRPILPDVNVAEIGGDAATPYPGLETDVTAIKAKTDSLPPDPADASVVAASFDAVNTTLGTIAGNVDTLEGRLPAALVSGRMDCSVGAVAAVAAKIKKNTALAGFSFVMTDSINHVPTAGLTVTATRSLDGAAFAACANAASAISNGGYKIDLAAADLNANTVLLRFTATGADDVMLSLITQP